MQPKKIGLTLAALALVYVVGAHFGVLPGRMTREAVVPEKVDLSAQGPTSQPSDSDVQAVPLPSSTPATIRGPEIRVKVIPWNAEIGHHFAVGGLVTTKGSLMEKYGVRVSVERKDDDMKALEDLVKLAQAIHDGTDEPTVGAHFVIDMGDAMAQYIAACNKLTSKLGPDYRCEIIGSVGYSRGEDKCMGLPEWKDNPEAMKGAVIAAQLRQGDWNLCQYFEAQNGLKNNPDETTWDADAVNWYSTDDFAKATEAYVGHAKVTLDVVRGGKKTGEKVEKYVNGVATWTPGDVDLAKKKGGLVTLLSTKENAYQMAATVIGIHKWNVAHAKLVKAYLKAALEGGDQVRHFDAALQRAGKASFAIYKEQNPAYWVKYYKGVTESDKTGLPISLGGSVTMGLDDNLCLFGLADGCGTLATSMYNASYTGFGKIVQQQYPRLLPSFPPIEEAVNTTFLAALAAERTTKGEKPELVEFDPGDATEKVAKRDWNITFVSGSDVLTADAEKTLGQLYDALLVGGGLSVEIDGHTDNTGTKDGNDDLSRRRAERVNGWLAEKAPAFFAKGRVSVKAFGQTVPVASNDTPEGRAKNRRVSIVLGSKG